MLRDLGRELDHTIVGGLPGRFKGCRAGQEAGGTAAVPHRWELRPRVPQVEPRVRQGSLSSAPKAFQLIKSGSPS